MTRAALLLDDWYRNFFGETYRRSDLERQPAEKTALQIRCVIDELELPPHSRVLDLGCGTGRHSLGLAAAGMEVTGVDLNETYVQQATTSARAVDPVPRFIHGDMRDLSFAAEDSIDAVVSLHTSFGLFHDDAENHLVLEEAARVLRPGGALMIDLLNRDWLLKSTEPAYFVKSAPETVSRDYDIVDGDVTLHERVFDPLSSRLRWTITPIAHPDEAAVAEWRVYSAHEIVALVSSVGLTEVRLTGDYEGGAFHATAPRLICVARAPTS